MKTKYVLLFFFVLIGLVFTTNYSPATDDDVKRTSEKYGFLGPETIKIGSNMQGLRALDFDADGKMDFMTVKVSERKVFISYQANEPAAQTGGPAQEATMKFQTESLTLEKSFSYLNAGDIDGDKKADLVFLDSQNKLNILFHKKDARAFEPPKEIPLDDIKGGVLKLVDLNGDGVNEIVIVNEDNINIISCDAERNTRKPIKYENNSKKIVDFGIADINGDKLKDIILVNSDKQTIAFRLQRPDATLAPEITQKIEDIDIGNFADINNDAKDELLGLHSQTNALKIFRFLQPAEFKTAPKKKFQFSQLRDYQFKGGTSASYSLAIGDLNGDARADIVVADSSRAEINLYLQGKSSELEEKQIFPSLIDTKAVAIGDLDNDKKNEVVILSTQEKTIGVLPMTAENRLLFPKPLFPIDLVPTALVLADINRDNKKEVIYSAHDEKMEKGFIFVMTLDQKNCWSAGQKIELNSKQGIMVDQIKVVDINNDNLQDLIVFFEISSPVIFIQQKDGKFQDVTDENQTLKGLLNKLNPENITFGNLPDQTTGLNQDKANALLICRKNFARSFVWKDNNQLEIIDQYNGKSTEASVQTAVTINLDDDKAPEIVLYDSQSRQLSILKKTGNNAYEIAENTDVGYFNIKEIFAQDINNDGIKDLLLFGQDHFGILYAGIADPQFEPLAGHTTTIKKGVYTKYAVGDVNSDGVKDIVIIEGKRHNLEILSINNKNELKQELTFPIFEDPETDLLDEETDDPRWRNLPTNEPREIKIVDINNDKKNDILLLAHRNLIIYLQE
ncbi:MAG: VCBS repeat-containing protein [Planctomycetota bacterium]